MFTTVFPNSVQQLHGLFVAERARYLASHADIRVVAPVARFPWRDHCREWRAQREDLWVEYPTFQYIPGLFRILNGLFLFLSSVRTVSRLRAEFDFDLIDAHFGLSDGFAAYSSAGCSAARSPLRYVAMKSRCSIIDCVGGRRLGAAPGRGGDSRRSTAGGSGVVAGVPAERVSVIENGIDGERFRPIDRRAARRRLGLDEAGKLIVSVGHRSRRKGFQRVLRVIPALLPDFPDLRFAVIGGPGSAARHGPSSSDRSARWDWTGASC